MCSYKANCEFYSLERLDMTALKHITQLPRCEKWLKRSCLEHFDAIDCLAAGNFCRGYLAEPYGDLGTSNTLTTCSHEPLTHVFTELNPYDITQKCSGSELSETLCYPILRYVPLKDVSSYLPPLTSAPSRNTSTDLPCARTSVLISL
jgi:cathepsin A (carboxypeptidase C)